MRIRSMLAASAAIFACAFSPLTAHADTAGPGRLDVFARHALPYVGSVGALDMVNFGAFANSRGRFRAARSALLQAYERFRQPQGLPATYQVVYAVLHKPQHQGD
mgnify:CR=1 FL=1